MKPTRGTTGRRCGSTCAGASRRARSTTWCGPCAMPRRPVRQSAVPVGQQSGRCTCFRSAAGASALAELDSRDIRTVAFVQEMRGRSPPLAACFCDEVVRGRRRGAGRTGRHEHQSGGVDRFAGDPAGAGPRRASRLVAACWRWSIRSWSCIGIAGREPVSSGISARKS